MLRRSINAVVTIIGLSLLATSAIAHPKLIGSSPVAGAAVDASLHEVRLNFNETLVPKFSGAEIKDEQGKRVDTGAPAADPAAPKVMVVPLLGPLAEGTYTVDWHAVAADTHRVQGSYAFTVKR